MKHHPRCHGIIDSSKKIPLRIALLALLALGATIGGALPARFAAASPAPFSNLTDEKELRSYDLGLDPNLSSVERKSLAEDFNVLSQMDLRPDPSEPFRYIFGGEGTAQIKKYLKRRVHFLLSVKNDPALAKQLADEGAGTAPTHGMTMAANIGPLMWYQVLASGQSQSYSLGGKTLEINSTRIGVIQLGPGYTKVAYAPFPPETIAVNRMGILIHEARHSDCTGGFTAQDLADMSGGRRPQNPACGHAHTKCPPGHIYAGLPACDNHPWGAYAIEAAFHFAVAKNCANCTQLQKQSAHAFYLDAKSRVPQFNDMMNGKMGPPNMSSSGQITFFPPEFDQLTEIFQQ